MCTGYHAVHQLVHIVLVVVDGGSEAQVIVLGTQNLIVERELDTLVRGLTDILILIAETSRGIAGNAHQNILGGVPVELDATAQLAIPEAEVQTDVTRDGGLPLQVGVS